MAQPEALTDEDRERADLVANNPHLGRDDRLLVAKLVRIHDAQAELIAELERALERERDW
jgi:hypothetical protein